MVVRVLSGVFRGEEYPILCFRQSFCMAKFVKCVWMCELVLGDAVEQFSVYIVLVG